MTVEEAFSFQHPVDKQVAGEGAYVSATVNNRRYYGVLVDQATLKAASLLHLQQEAVGLDLNRRIKTLMPSELAEQLVTTQAVKLGAAPQQVQKFRFVDATDTKQGYRELLATFSDTAAAADDDIEKEKLIEAACAAGGNFVGRHYYQYLESAGSTLLPVTERKETRAISLAMSMGFNSFLEATPFPAWSPPVNLDVGQQTVLNMLQLKKDKKGNFVPDQAPVSLQTIPVVGLLGQAIIPMEPRQCFRVSVVGGGIAGLSACLEIFRQCEEQGIDVEVHLMEGRSRLGGRLHTDRETFKRSDGAAFPVDLGASWIHGIEMNPLAALAREAGVDFVVTSEEVKMLQGNMEVVDAAKDTHAGELFDKLLDAAAEMTWSSRTRGASNKQSTIRWYASVLDKENTHGQHPEATDVPFHRRSSDVSVDHAVGLAIAKDYFDEFQSLSVEERRMLFWNTKNVEYALGANLSDLSQLYWDIDERHAFEGDHVVLKQGYTVVIEHMLDQLRQRGRRFQCHVNCPVGKIEYSRPSTGQTYIGKTPKRLSLLDLSDTCCVTSEDGNTRLLCDFVVCAVPLGVLKHALSEATNQTTQRLSFDPPLPFSKVDSINTVGFGLLDKVYLQFPNAFWRTDKTGQTETHTLFGNASGVYPHHYMFLDVGKALDTGVNPPAVLMSLVSGMEAVACEWLSPDELVREVMTTLRALFAPMNLPDPISVKTTRWGFDRFSRGSYTFLGPGTTDADFHVLQSPCNGNGDGILLDGSETMRLFFAGEHTTALHPSMAHGAMLSGIRAGREVFDAVNLAFDSEHMDRMIPLCLYRHMNPKAPLFCALCRGGPESLVEGQLLAFKRGSRSVCVHNNCAEASAEVEVADGKWQHVVKAVNRGLQIECFFCEQTGATIGCQEPQCNRSFHFACASRTGWDFGALGKEFLCENHRDKASLGTADGSFQHDLFARSNGEFHEDESVQSNLRKSGSRRSEFGKSDDAEINVESLDTVRLAVCEEECHFSSTRLVRMTRASSDSCWNMGLGVRKRPDSDAYLLSITRSKSDHPYDDVVHGDMIKSINGRVVGSPELDTLERVLSFLKQEVDVLMQVQPSTAP